MKWYERAKLLMKKQQIIQEHLIKPLGCKVQGTVGHYLTGRREPGIDQYATLCRILGVSMDELYYGEQTHNDHLYTEIRKQVIDRINVFDLGKKYQVTEAIRLHLIDRLLSAGKHQPLYSDLKEIDAELQEWLDEFIEKTHA